MSSLLVVRNHQRTCLIELPLLRQVTRDLLQRLFPKQAYQLGIHLVTPKQITRLNQTFVRHQGSTDVITFDYRERSDSQILHGEIFVCIDEALAQAARFRTCWQSEVVRYLVHGLLHLAGYDDRRRSARYKMKQAENRLLKNIAARFTLTPLGRPKQNPKPEGPNPKKGRSPSIRD